MIISDTAALVRFCDALRTAPYIAVDTEFMREKTYYARLCLVQVAYGDHAAAIDPLAPGLDLTPLRLLLHNEAIVKVFHACSQDVEIFLQQTGKIPAPLFDTQLAAAACGLGEQPGYATLVHSLLGIEIDKSSQATDWSLRPLSARQVEYAIGDVTHLCRVYERLQADLVRTGRTSWVAEEMAALVDESRYRIDPREAYRRLKIRGPSRKTLNVLRELAAWRELTARDRDVPRPWIVADEALVEIAQHRPTDVEALVRVRALKPGVAKGRDGQALLDVVARAVEIPEDEWPDARERKPTSDRNESLVALLSALLRLRCEEAGVAMWLVASRDDLDALASADSPDVPAIHGWRRGLFGEDALALRDGRLALTGKDGGVVAVAR